MDADKESRSRQYEGTAMSDDEVSKVPKIQAFGKYAKRYIRDKSLLSKFLNYLDCRINYCQHFAMRAFLTVCIRAYRIYPVCS